MGIYIIVLIFAIQKHGMTSGPMTLQVLIYDTSLGIFTALRLQRFLELHFPDALDVAIPPLRANAGNTDDIQPVDAAVAVAAAKARGDLMDPAAEAAALRRVRVMCRQPD